ncbi:sugar-binding domain-containing protein [Saccharibacillus sp. CPCC 101409]|uniref:sugar-binding transcriptional regulator n=1 Tax=Saccharibacillus sp. CPCC 101409 TaxID=3058041 RepID=UPI002672241E|nr:sugar-binding domain-containing protein [Saccharibacillus sp. CPCC 101409]MDO3413097.1 sugar-binding domain-containing protein [Saccharibacillus sp. CPCC 101409]
MQNILEIQQQLLPDLMETLKKRYTILHQIMLTGTTGRRTLAHSLQMTERVLRAETDLLKAQGLIETDTAGMRISDAGQLLLERLEPVLKELVGLSNLEEKIRRFYGLRKVVVVPGNCEESPLSKRELGKAGAKALLGVMRGGDVVAVTGGTTLAEMAEQLTHPVNAPLKGSWFVPARGGLGESLEIQANTIASNMAKRVGADYRLLHVPDLLSREAYESLVHDPNIQEIVGEIRTARIVVHGIGDAMEMARRRKLDAATTSELRQKGAVAESFGYYFDESGSVVHNMLTLGLRLDDIKATDIVLGIAGGRSKAKSIHAVLRFGQEDILVLDEAAAIEIVQEMERA